MNNPKQTFALYFGNRGFFPGELIAAARKEMVQAVTAAGYDYLMLDADQTRYGAVETVEEGRLYAEFLRAHAGEYQGVIVCLPNFGDENGAVAALRDCGVPILIQAYKDEIGKMDFNNRRDAFCGKFSIMDVFCQYHIPFTIFKPHTVNPTDPAFAEQLQKFGAVCRVVSGMKRFSIGAIGARTTAFKTVRYDELTLQKYGITVEALDLSELFALVRGEWDAAQLSARVERLNSYVDCTGAPAEKVETLAKVSLAIDRLIAQYHLDSIALRCWNEMQSELGIAPCVLLSELNDRGVVAACELDVCNAVTMRALSLASEDSATCLDWNNNYQDEENKCILFHCGPVPQSLMESKGTLIDHKMFAKSYGTGCGMGVNQGRIAAFDMTFASAKTEDGKLCAYIGQGRFTGEKYDPEFFGTGGVAEIDNLQNTLYYIGKNGYRHHVSVTRGDVFESVREAFETYLGYDVKTM